MSAIFFYDILRNLPEAGSSPKQSDTLHKIRVKREDEAIVVQPL